MASYTTLSSGGDSSTSGPEMYVYLYPNESEEDDECEDEIHAAIDDNLSDLLNKGVINYYEIYISYAHPSLDESDISMFRSQFTDWLGSRLDYKGIHVGVADGFDDANGQDVEGSDCQTGFSTGTHAVVGTSASQDKYTNYAVQEPMHNVIRYDLPKVQDLIHPDGTKMHEHDLGNIDVYQRVTPLATLYESTHADHGDCATPEDWNGNYRSLITSCTVDAVDYTAQHAQDNC